MQTEFFLSQKRSLLQNLRSQLDVENRRTQSQLVNPYDTGCGSDDHNYRANQRAKQNGAVLKKSQIKENLLYDAIANVSNATSLDDMWQLFLKICWFIKAEHQDENGKIDWSKLHKKAVELDCCDSYTLGHTIYSHFWV